jgi:outer membrane receptor protein involved in Fe transport
VFSDLAPQSVHVSSLSTCEDGDILRVDDGSSEHIFINRHWKGFDSYQSSDELQAANKSILYPIGNILYPIGSTLNVKWFLRPDSVNAFDHENRRQPGYRISSKSYPNFVVSLLHGMKQTILTLALAFLLTASYGQEKNPGKENGKISGKVIDSFTNRPLEYATVSLFRAGKKTPINGTTSDSSGYFEITKFTSGNYYLTIEFVGFRTIEIKSVIVNQKSDVIDLKNIYTTRKSSTLESVTVTAPAKLVENKIDKLVFNAEKDITSQTGVATDVLKKVPQVSVDVDGNVELQGSTDIRFLINGKPSTIFGSNIVDVLQSIPANQIKSIEVITNPGAKYDAQGTGGIINIILKHSTVQGINGNVSLTAGTIVQNGALNINARKGKFGLNAFINGNARLTTTTKNNLERVSTDTATKANALLQQDGSSDFNRHGLQSGVGFDWSMNDMNTLAGALNYHDFGNKYNSITSQVEHILYGGNIVSEDSAINHTNSQFKQYSFDPSLNFKHNFKNKEHDLEIGMDGSFAHNSNVSGGDQYLQPQDSLIYGTRNNNPAKENQYEMMVDYSQPLSKDVNLGMGGKFSGYDISSSAHALIWNSNVGDYVYDSVLSNELNYHQRVYAAYAELNFPVGKLFDARLGGRYERTQVNSFYANAKQKVEEGYNTYIPSIFLMKKAGENQTFKLSFTIRINRPDYFDLNPYINTSDPKNVTTGNPNLKPEVWDRYEASYIYDFGKAGSMNITLFYRISNDDIQPFIVYYPTIKVGDTTYTNVAVTTRENVGIEKNAGTNLFFDFRINEKFGVRTNFMFIYRHTINHVDTGFNSTGTIFRGNLNASYQFTNSFAAEFFGSFNSRHQEAQGKYPQLISYSLAARKFIWNKKASIALTANNFFSKYVNQQTTLYGPGFVTSNLRKIPYQSFGINFTWKFGKLEVKKEKSEEVTPELSAPQQ